jgi:hypothetical protein
MTKKKPPGPGPVMTRAETARYFARSDRWVDDMVLKGRLRPIRFGARKGFCRDDVERLAAEGNPAA